MDIKTTLNKNIRQSVKWPPDLHAAMKSQMKASTLQEHSLDLHRCSMESLSKTIQSGARRDKTGLSPQTSKQPRLKFLPRVEANYDSNDSRRDRRSFRTFSSNVKKMSDIYCAEQIKIPPTFPHILKLYAKAAIRTQPYDLLRWTCAYFRALAKDELPPVKERLEYPPFSHPSGITPGYLRTLLNMFGPVEKICLSTLLETWQGIALSESTLYQILLVGKFLPERECHFYKFLAIACGFLGKNLLETAIYVCELLTEEPEGGSAMIPLPIFLRLYGYLAELDCSGVVPPTVCQSEDAEELFRPCGPISASDESSSTFDSRLYRVPTATTAEEEEDTHMDVCEPAPSESRSSDNLQTLKDYHADARRSEIDEMHQEQTVSLEGVTIHPMDHREHEPNSELTDGRQLEGSPDQGLDRLDVDQDYFPDFHPDDFDSNIYGGSSSDFAAEEDEKETSFEEVDDYEPVGLEDILHGICECLEPVRESPREPTPPPPDPVDEFLDRMKNEVEEGRLETVFHVSGIGPTVSRDRVTAVGLWLADCARQQEGLVGPRNIRHFLCPDLQDPDPQDWDEVYNICSNVEDCRDVSTT
ncbi:uncharacterized protein LOC143347146 [Colletes latitarsis]|uniref:uncharacterized protein LOC143347146 n=1 Tax=Colletes latitarsis TaxID=2605962 RepID=UPI004035055B